MRGHLDHELQIAWCFVVPHAVARLVHGARGAVLNARGNFHCQCATVLGEPASATSATRSEHDLARSAAARASAFDGYRKQRLLEANLPASSARRTSVDPRTRFRAAPCACVARVEPFIGHFTF